MSLLFLTTPNFMKSKFLFLILFILLLVTTVSAQSVVSNTYGDGWIKECYDDNTCAVSNHHTIMRWDGQYIGYDKLNFNNGDWTYKVDINTDNITLTRLDDKLVLPNNFNYTFTLNKISMNFTVTPNQFNARSSKIGNNWYVEIPEALVKTRFLWDNLKPTITNENGYSLDESNYWYQRYNNKYYLGYNQTARTFGTSSSLITFTFNSWVVGNSGNAWSGNSTKDNTTLNRDTNKIMLRQKVDDYVSYWRFDGSSDTVAYDENATANNNGALINGSSWNSSSKYGKAINLDGIDDYVQVAHADSLNITTNITLSAWIKTNSDTAVDQYQGFLNKGTLTDVNFYPRAYSMYLVYDELYMYYYNAGWLSDGTTIANIATNTWYYVTYTRNGMTKWNWYLNGINSSSGIPSSTLVSNTNPLNIGAGYLTGEMFNGLIDDVRIYNYVLTNDQINQTMVNTMELYGNISTSYNFGSNYRGSQVKATYTNDTNSFLDLYASSDNTTWYLVQDNASNNTYYNIPTSVKNQTQYIRAVLKGNATSTPEVYSLTILGELQTITLNYVSSTLPDNAYINVNYTQVNISFSNTFADASLNTFIFNWNGTNTSYSNTSGSITNCSTTLKCFYTNVTNLVDGNYTYYGWLNDTFGNSNISAIRSVTIDTVLPTIDFIPPTDANNTVVSRNYIFINTSVSDANNITALIDFNHSLVGWWRFNEGTGTVTQDYSGYGNNGTLTNMNTGIDNCTGNCSGWTTSGKFGNAIQFDGVNDYVNMGKGNGFLDFSSNQSSFSVSAWFKSKYWKSGDSSNELVKKYSWGLHDGWVLIGRGGDICGMQLMSKTIMSADSNRYTYVSCSSNVSLNQWHHAVGVVNRNVNQVSFYLDGRLTGSVSILNWTLANTSNMNLLIGHEGSPIGGMWNYSAFNGTIDEIRIYNRALSPEEINASYNVGLYPLFHNFTNLSDGTYNYTAYIQDAAGNVNSTNKQYVTIDTVPITINLLSQTPSTISQNTTGLFNQTWGVSHGSIGLNNSTLAYIHSMYDILQNTRNHSIRPPSNNKSVVWNVTGEQILRATHRNETLTFENNASITGGNIYEWGGSDYYSQEIHVEPVNSTYTRIYFNNSISGAANANMWYLDRSDMQNAPKTVYQINKFNSALIKYWDLKTFIYPSHIVSMQIDTSLGALSPTLPIEIYYLNASYDPIGTVNPESSPYAYFITTLNVSQWTNHIFSPTSNASYITLTFNTSNILSVGITPTTTSYIYFKSGTQVSKSYNINVTNVATSTNISFANTGVMWTGTTAPFSAYSYTPNIYFSFTHSNQRYDSMLYIADNYGKWNNSTLQSSLIEVSVYPPNRPNVDHFQYPTTSDFDYDMNKTYSGIFNVAVAVANDPDGGTVTHNLSLWYADRTYIATINNTFTQDNVAPGEAYVDIAFDTTPYYSNTNLYTLKVVATDNEGMTSETWLKDNFSLNSTQSITNLSAVVGNFYHNWTWTNPTDTIFNYTEIYINNSFIVNTSSTYFNLSAAPHNQSTLSTHTVDVAGNINSTWINNTSIIPNNPITIVNISDSYQLMEGQQLYIDANYNDADNDVSSYDQNFTQGSFSSLTGILTWNTIDGDQGVYNWQINVSDGYGSISEKNFTVTVTDTTPTPITNLANTTGNFYINWTYNSGANADRYAIQIDGTNIDYTTNLYYNDTYTSHASKTISVATHNDTLNANSSWVNQTTTIPNNVPVIDTISDKNTNEGLWLNFTVTGTDVDSDVLTCSSDSTKGTLSGCDYSWNVGYLESGVYTWMFEIDDGHGGTDSETINITVQDIPLAITNYWNSINGWNQNVMSLNAGNSATFNVTVNHTASYISWKVAGTEEQNTSSLQFTRAFGSLGNYNVTAQAYSNDGISNTIYTIVTVTSGGGNGTDYDYAYGWIRYTNGTPIETASIITTQETTYTNSNGYYSFGYVFEHNVSYNFEITKDGVWDNKSVMFSSGDFEVVNGTLGAPSIVSWNNDFTANDTLYFVVNKHDLVNFSTTANQTINTWTWTYASSNGSSATTSYASRNFSDVGWHNVTVSGSNLYGSTQNITWAVFIYGVENLTLSGYVKNNLEYPLEAARVDVNGGYVFTDVNGYYSITNISEENYTVLARAIGYINSSRTINMNNNITANFTLPEKGFPVIKVSPGVDSIGLIGLIVMIFVWRSRRKG